MTVKQFLETEFPELRGKISGGNHPPPEYATYLMKAISAMHMIAIAFIFLGDTAWNFVPFVSEPPQWYKTCRQYPIQTFIFLFFLVPTIVQSKLTTGAFEIMLDGEVLFSKISSGRFPNGPELIEIFTKAGLTK